MKTAAIVKRRLYGIATDIPNGSDPLPSKSLGSRHYGRSTDSKKSPALKLFPPVGRIGLGHWLAGRGLAKGLASAWCLQAVTNAYKRVFAYIRSCSAQKNEIINGV